MLRPSPNHGTLRRHNDDDDDEIKNILIIRELCATCFYMYFRPYCTPRAVDVDLIHAKTSRYFRAPAQICLNNVLHIDPN